MGFDWDTRIYCILTINPIQSAYSDFQQLAHLVFFCCTNLPSEEAPLFLPVVWCVFLDAGSLSRNSLGWSRRRLSLGESLPCSAAEFLVDGKSSMRNGQSKRDCSCKIMGVCFFQSRQTQTNTTSSMSQRVLWLQPNYSGAGDKSFCFFVKQNNTLQPLGAWFFLWTCHVIEPVIYKFIWSFECFQFWWFVRGCPSGKSTRISKITKFGSIDISRTKWFKMTFWFSIVGGHFTFPKGHSTIPQTGHNELVYEVFRTSRTKIHQCFISTSTKCSLPGCSRGHGILVWMVRFVEGALTLQKLFFFLDAHHIPLLKGWFAVNQPPTKLISYRWLD